jgi:hypothetical protein
MATAKPHPAAFVQPQSLNGNVQNAGHSPNIEDGGILVARTQTYIHKCSYLR